RCRSPREVAAAPIARRRSKTAVGGPGGRCPAGRIGSDRIDASMSAGFLPLSTCAAALTPDEVPITRSAKTVRSTPASARPAMMPIVHACPAEPPPPRTRATCLAVAGPLPTSVEEIRILLGEIRFRGFRDQLDAEARAVGHVDQAVLDRHAVEALGDVVPERLEPR